jgi:chorismate mutase
MLKLLLRESKMKNWLPKLKILTLPLLFFSCLAVAGIAKADTVPTNLLTPVSPEDTSTIDQRLAARKVEFKAQITAVDIARLPAKCVLSQTALTDVRNKDNKAAAIRQDAYSLLATRLSYLVDNLSSQSVDASELLNAQNSFVTAVNTYSVDAGYYKAAMDDAINVSCKDDPAAFKASLLDARAYRAQLAKDVAAIKANMKPVNQALSDERQVLIKNPGHAPVGTVGTKAH